LLSVAISPIQQGTLAHSQYCHFPEIQQGTLAHSR